MRRSILAELERGPMTALDISRTVGIREKEVCGHLEHLQRSLRRSRQRLVVDPAECVACGYVFEHRSRLKKPSSCPECRASRIHPPRYRLARSAGDPGGISGDEGPFASPIRPPKPPSGRRAE